MEKNKNGADAATPTPREAESSPNKHINSNKLNRICLGIQIISLVAFFVAYHRQAENALHLWGGVLATASIIHAAVYPIEEDDENEI